MSKTYRILAEGWFVFCALNVSVAQEVKMLPQQNLARWNVPPGNYSGIAPLGDGRYAVVDDKEPREGFFVFRIEQDEQTGQVTGVWNEGFRGQTSSLSGGRDAEGVAFVPDDGLVWVSGEADQRVTAYRTDGVAAGRELAVPDGMGRASVQPNYGFEALCYEASAGLFWTVTENALKADLRAWGDTACLRLQSFDVAGQPQAQYAYPLDLPQAGTGQRQYAHGVVALWAPGNGRLWVLEREMTVSKRRLKSRSFQKLYEVEPRSENILSPDVTVESVGGRWLKKRLLASFSTRMRLIRPPLADYEGMCEGCRLADGRRTLLLISDSQGGYGNRMCHLRDWISVLVLPKQ